MGVSASGPVSMYKQDALCEPNRRTQLYYADKGVVFRTDLVILATQSTKRLAFLRDVLPHV